MGLPCSITYPVFSYYGQHRHRTDQVCDSGHAEKQGEPLIFKGRTMVTYVRHEESPTGWATIREIIQPATQ